MIQLLPLSPALFLTLLQLTPSLSSSHMHLLRYCQRNCCFMPFSSAHAIGLLRLFSEALLTQVGAPLSVLIILLQLFVYLKKKKSHLKDFLTSRWKGCPWVRYNWRNRRVWIIFFRGRGNFWRASCKNETKIQGRSIKTSQTYSFSLVPLAPCSCICDLVPNFQACIHLDAMYYNYTYRYCYYTHRPDFITCKFKFNIWLVIWKMGRLTCCVGKKYMPYYCYWLQLKRMRTERALISWNALPCASSVFKVFKNVQIQNCVLCFTHKPLLCSAELLYFYVY